MVVNGDQETVWKVLRGENNSTVPEIYTNQARFRWPLALQALENNPFKYFLLFWSNNVMNDIVTFTSEHLVSSGFRPLTKGELYKWMGIRVYMAINPIRGDIKKYWNENKESESMYVAHNLKQSTGMSRHRFENITSCLCIKEQSNETNADVSPITK